MTDEERAKTERIIRKTREKYGDIIDLPHPEPKGRPRMPMSDRAAIFAPFAALSGQGERVREAERQVEEMMQEDKEAWYDD